MGYVMRPAHIITPTGRTAGYPDLSIFFDTETYPDPQDEEFQKLHLGWAVSTRAGRPGEDQCFFTDREQFWDFVESKTLAKKKLWCFGANVFFDLRVLEWERALTERGWEIVTALFPDPNGPLHIEARRDGRTLVFSNLSNFWGIQSLSRIGKSLGFDKTDMSVEFGEPPGTVHAGNPRFHPDRGCRPGSHSYDVLSRYCLQDVRVLARAMRVYIDFCKTNDLGPFALTLPGQAFGAWRHRFMTEFVYIHTNDAALELERAASNGGLTDVWYNHPINQAVYYNDVNSLYPAMMRDHQYPTRLIGYFKRDQIGVTYQRPALDDKERVAQLRDHLDTGHLVVARVRVDTTMSCLPDVREQAMLPQVRSFEDGTRLCYPYGRFVTAAATPELRTALDAGIIMDVLELAVYEGADLFSEYVEFFYQTRLKYKEEDNLPFSEVCKLFMNSLYGKFGQHNFVWETVDREVLAQSGTEKVLTRQENGIFLQQTVRRIGDINQIRSEAKEEAMHSFPAVSAHVTSYGRAHLRRLRETAGYDHTFYADTDSVMVDETGQQNLIRAGILDPDTLGMLKTEMGDIIGAHFRAPKHYTLTRENGVSVHKHKGIPHNATELSPDVWKTTQFQGAAGALREGNLNRAKVSPRIKHVQARYSKGTVDPDGWTRPHHVEDW
jgi:hypothetical protein